MLGGLTPVAAALLVAWLGAWPVRATSPPSGIESAIAGHALRTALARGARNLVNPLAASDSTLLAGMKIYRDDCAGCHGDVRHPSHWGNSNFYPRVPQFADAPPELTTPELFLAIQHGIRYSGMGAWDGELSTADMWRVAMFLGQLRSLPPAVAEAWNKPPAPQP